MRSGVEELGVEELLRDAHVFHDFHEYRRRYLTAVPTDEYKPRVPALGWERAYVSYFAGESYIPLVEVIVDAVHTFSKLPLLLYVSGDTVIPRSWHMRFPHLVVYKMPTNVLHPWFDKLRVILLANVRRGVILEADTIITPSADRLFDVFDRLNASTLALLAPQHPDLRLSPGSSCPVSDCAECCVNPYPFPNEAREGRGLYRHAHIVWEESSKGFVADVLRKCVTGRESNFDCSSDEAALNMAIWTSDLAVEQLCLQDPDRSFWRQVYDVGADPERLRAVQKQFGPRTIVFNFCHGAKSPQEAQGLLEMLKSVFSNESIPWILENGVMSSGAVLSTGLLGQKCIVA